MKCMLAVELRDFEARLTELLSLVEAGAEEITITRGTNPVAILTGVHSSALSVGNAVPAESIRSGNGERFSADWKPVRGSGKSASDLILEERAERF